MVAATCTLATLRLALKHLYEPRALQSSPLVQLLGPASESAAPALLRRTLVEGIESLKPEAGVTAQSPAWRIYEVLHYRYVQQCCQEEVADQLGLSVRQLKREQSRALEVLAQRLQERFGFKIAFDDEPEADFSPEGQEATPMVGDDLQWLDELPKGQSVALETVLPAVLGLVHPIAARYGVLLHAIAEERLPELAVHSVTLRQILLSVLCVGIRQTPGGKLTIAVHPSRWQVTLQVEGQQPVSQPAQSSAEDTANLAMALRLVGSCAGTLTIAEPPAPFAATISLPIAQRVPVLVIDDHLDALRLLERYATDTRYRVYGVQNAAQAFAMAAETAPQIIVLDVMMPDVDGWELLGRLKQHPLTRSIPVVACTILAQEELAFSLGVSAFLRKPVSRRDFLATLEKLAPGEQE